MRPRDRAVLGGAFAAVAAAFACSESSTDPNAVLSIQILPTQLPSIVLGDSIHDTTGAVDSLHATAFNSKGLAIAGAPIRFLAVGGRPMVAVDTIRGQVVGLGTVDTLRDTLNNITVVTRALVLAKVPGLQTQPDTIFVVLRPDSLMPVDTVQDTLDYSLASLRDTTIPVRVKLMHLPLDSVPHYRLEFAWTYPLPHDNTNPSMVQLVNVSLLPQLVDTTSVFGGVSTLVLRATLVADTVTDSVAFNVFAYLPDHTPVPGSPVHFVVKLHIH